MNEICSNGKNQLHSMLCTTVTPYNDITIYIFFFVNTLENQALKNRELSLDIYRISGCQLITDSPKC